MFRELTIVQSEDEDDRDKKDEDQKDGEKVKADGKDKPASGVDSKGTNTPSGRKEKKAENAKKGKSLKRPGSPNLSESSGNESSRKRAKKNPPSSIQPSRSGTPIPRQQRGKGGAASDGEEMSDGGRGKKKIKLLGTGAKGTPAGSRAGSPVPAAGEYRLDFDFNLFCSIFAASCHLPG